MNAKANQRLVGRVAIVTGAGAGIGKAEALLLASQGAHVVANDIAHMDGSFVTESVVDQIKAAGGSAVSDTNDIATFSGAQELVANAIRSFQRIDIVVNNAGISTLTPVHELDEAQWDRMLAVHLKGTFGVMKYATQHMCRQQGGAIVNTSSESGLGRVFGANYCAAKEGIVGLTRAVARELGRFNVRCNAVRPRAATTILSSIDPAPFLPLMEALGRNWVGHRAPALSDMVAYRPEAVAQLVTWLCTDAASNINGREFFVAGEEIGIYPQLDVERMAYRQGGWDLDSLDLLAENYLTQGLTNDFLLEDFPDLQHFEG